MTGGPDTRSTKTSIQTAVILLVCLLPGLLVNNFVPVLDTYPYVVSAVLGIMATAGIWQLLEKPSFRDRFRFLDGWLKASGLGAILFLAGPSWGIAFGFTANRLLDRSADVEHRTTMLSIKRSRKGVDSTYLASWRPGEEQILVPFSVGSPLSKLPRSAGTPIYVSTRRGLFHFQYVSNARPLGDDGAVPAAAASGSAAGSASALAP